MSNEIQVSTVTATAAETANRLRSQNRPLPVFGTRKETRSFEKRGFLGRVEMVEQSVDVPILAPGWPTGVSVPILEARSGTVTHDLMLTPEGHLQVVRVDPDELTKSAAAATGVFMALRTVQCAAGDPVWVATGNGDDQAATYPSSGINTTAAEAAATLIARLKAM